MADPLETFPTLPGQFLLLPLFLVAPGTSGPRLLCLLYPFIESERRNSGHPAFTAKANEHFIKMVHPRPSFQEHSHMNPSVWCPWSWPQVL